MILNAKLGGRAGLTGESDKGKKMNALRFVSALLILLILAGCYEGPDSMAVGDDGNAPSEVSVAAKVLADQFIYVDQKYAPYVRWALPGGDITAEQLTKELEDLKVRGIGGVEIVGLTFGDDPKAKNVGPTGHYPQMINHVLKEGERLGLAVELTAGSGWIQGGPFIQPGTNAIQQEVLFERFDLGEMNMGEKLPDNFNVPKQTQSKPFYLGILSLAEIINSLGSLIEQPKFDPSLQELLGISAARKEEGSYVEFVDISQYYDGEKLNWQAPTAGEWSIFTLFVNDVLFEAIGAAYDPGAGPAYVLNPLSKAGVNTLINELLVPWDNAFPEEKPASYFFDSFEFNAQLSWTDEFAQEFQARKGYNIIPYLPFISKPLGDSEHAASFVPFVPDNIFLHSSSVGKQVREDYEEVRTQLFIENFIVPMREWTHEVESTLKVQHYGYILKGDYQKVGLEVDLHDTEHLYASGNFQVQKTITSTARMTGRNLVSSESFVKFFTLGPEISDSEYLPEETINLLAGRSYAAGVNRLTFHTKAYDRDSINEWWPYTLFTFDVDRSEHWENLTGLTTPWSRLGFLMQQGNQAATVAVMHTEKSTGVMGANTETINLFDVIRYAIFGDWPYRMESRWSRALRNSGYSYNTIEPGLFRRVEINGEEFCILHACFESLLLSKNSFDSLAIEDLEGLVKIAEAGFPITSVGDSPLSIKRARGFFIDEDIKLENEKTVESLLENLSSAIAYLDSADGVVAQLAAQKVFRPVEPIRRDLNDLTTHYTERKDDVFVLFFNESNSLKQTKLRPNYTGEMYWMEPYSGAITPLGSPSEINLTVKPLKMGVLWIKDSRVKE